MRAVELVLLRHAKSAWPDVPDHERPLAPRGRRNAAAAGRWLLQAGHLPALVLCSTARRARETWELAQAEIGPVVPARFEDIIYRATPAGLLDLIRGTPTGTGTLMVIGHDPAIPQLAAMLAGDPGAAGRDAAPAGDRHQPGPLDRMQVKYPTAAAAVLQIAGVSWRQASPGRARLLDFMIPRDLPGQSRDGT